MSKRLVQRLHEPEYTGDDRCLPCTVVNLLIAGVLGAAIARKSRLGGVVAVAVSVGLIYLRGYLVPGTPTLTKRYLPATVLDWFGKEPEIETAGGLGAPGAASPGAGIEDGPGGGTSETAPEADTAASEGDAATAAETDPATDDGGVDLETYFLQTGVLELCAEADDLCLTEGFEDAWTDVLADTDVDETDVEDIVDAFDLDDTGEYTVESHGDAAVVRRDDTVVGQWPSQAALVADVTAASVLSAWDPEWTDRSAVVNGQLLNGLRLFLPRCPDGEAVELTEETVESCCRSHEVVAAVCTGSGERLFEQRLDA